MKAFYILLFACCLGCFLPCKAADENEDDARSVFLHDSLMAVLDAMPLDSVRYSETNRLLLSFSRYDWSLELIERTYSDAKALNMKKEVLNALKNRCAHAQRRSNLEMQEAALEDLRKASYEYNDYLLYFKSAWYCIALRANQGDYEKALHKADLLKQEAVNLHYDLGETYAMMTRADVYRLMREDEKARRLYEGLLQKPGLDEVDLLNIHSLLIELYLQDKNYKQVLLHLDDMDVLLQDMVAGKKFTESWLYGRLLRIRLDYTDVYLVLNDTANAWKYLQDAKSYYRSELYKDYLAHYHASAAEYYAKVARWDDCLCQVDSALAIKKPEKLDSRMQLWMAKVKYLYQAGRRKESIDCYEQWAMASDTIIRQLLDRQEEVLAENMAVQQSLMQKEQIQKWIHLLYVVVSFLLFCFLMVLMRHAWRTRQSVKRARRETEKALKIVRQTDKMKEVFLKNITQRINQPLSEVVRFSYFLSTDEELAADKRKEYADKIKESAADLQVLVNDVLDLSRLEAGMMKFVKSDVDIVDLCLEVVRGIEFDKHIVVPFSSNVECLTFSTDAFRFSKMLLSCMSSFRKVNEEASSVRCDLVVEAETFTVMIQDSPLARQVSEVQDAFLVNEINRLFVEAFHGTYRMDEHGTITIKYKL